jgi:capping protein alpha
MADEEYEQATPEQKLNISNYFVMSSPTGEVHDVLVDVAKLVNDAGALDDAAIKKIMKGYNEEQLQPAETPDGNRVVVSAMGAVGEDEYLDPSSGKVFSFDHKKHEFTGESDKKQELAGNINAYRTAIAKALEGYSKSQFKKDKCTITVYGADDGTITVALAARTVHLSAFWTGGWRSVCTLNVSGKGTQEMKCKTNVNVHYFEDGNVQMHAAIEKTASVNVEDEDSTGAAVVKAVQKIESEFQASMEEMYVDMHRSTFKQMRRFLPITKQPMNWNTYAHGVMKEAK